MLRLAFAFMALAASMTTYGVPAAPGARSVITLADGRRVEAQLCGDEHMSFYLLSDGRTAVIDKNGKAQFVDEAEVRAEWGRRLNARNAERLAKRPNRNKVRFGGFNSIVGKKKGLVILVEYQDVKFVTPLPQATLQKRFNQVGLTEGGLTGSVRDYFLAQSYGQLDIDFDVVGPVLLSRTMDYYGGDNEKQHDPNAYKMVIEACQSIEDKVNFADYDWDGDGEVDQVFLIYAGYGQNYGGEANTVWPHEWQLRYSMEGAPVLDGVTVSTYGCTCELRGNSGTTLDGIGSACHEFSHCLGLPDFYDTGNQENFGMGQWDVMCGGSYLNSSNTPVGYTAYERWVSGWLKPVEITSFVEVKDMKALDDEPEAYVLYNYYNRDEYLLLENRQNKVWGASLAAHGLLVTHVDFDDYVWNSNSVNNTGSRQRMTIIPADDMLSGGTYAGDPFPGTKNNTSLTDTSTPAAKMYNAGPQNDMLLGKPIINIKESTDGLISFEAMRDAMLLPELNDAYDVGTNGFSISWMPLDGASLYELVLTEKPAPPATPAEALYVEEDFAGCVSKSAGLSDIGTKLDKYLASKGWTGSKLYTSPNKLKMGQGKNMGTITAPKLDMPLSGNLTFVIGVKPYSEGEVSAGVTLATDEGDMRGGFSVDTTTVGILHANNVTSSFKFTLAAQAVMYLTYFAVYDGLFSSKDLGLDAEEAPSEITAAHKAPRRALEQETFTTTDTHYTFSNLSPTSIYYVSVRGLNDNGASKWSLEKEVALNANDIVVPLRADVQKPAAIYDLSGRRVATPTRGLYIKDGKKIFMK